MKQLHIRLMGLFCVFSIYTADSEEKNSSRARLRALLTVATQVDKKQLSSTPVTSPRLKSVFSDDSLLSPRYEFSPDNVLKILRQRIQTYRDEVSKGRGTSFAISRDDSLACNRYRIERDLEAVEKRYVPGGSICDALEPQYVSNSLFMHKGAPLRVEHVIAVHLHGLAVNHKLPPEKLYSSHTIVYKLYQHVEKDWTLTRAERQQWRDIFDLVLSDQAAENYRHFLVKCSFNDLRFDKPHYELLMELKEQLNAVD